jgi:hypothetical protein
LALSTGSVDSFFAISSVETLALSKLLMSSSTTLGAVGNAVGFWKRASQQFDFDNLNRKGCGRQDIAGIG